MISIRFRHFIGLCFYFTYRIQYSFISFLYQNMFTSGINLTNLL